MVFLDLPVPKPARGGVEVAQRFLRLLFPRSGFHCACSVLQEFSAEERDPVKVTEGWGVMFTCSPPPHYPGKGDTAGHGFPRFSGEFREGNSGLIQSL